MLPLWQALPQTAIPFMSKLNKIIAVFSSEKAIKHSAYCKTHLCYHSQIEEN
jgi:hypothetical protein